MSFDFGASDSDSLRRSPRISPRNDSKLKEMKKTVTKVFNFREDVEAMKNKGDVDLVWLDFGK